MLNAAGAGLAKQIGAAGDHRRTDSMGMLLLQGGADADGATRVANTLAEIGVQIESLGQRMHSTVHVNVPEQQVLEQALLRLAESYEQSLLPLLSSLNHKMRLDHGIWDKVRESGLDIKDIDKRLARIFPADGPAG